MDAWEMDAYKMIEVLKQIGVFCDNTYKMAEYSKWTLKLRQIFHQFGIRRLYQYSLFKRAKRKIQCFGKIQCFSLVSF